MNHHETWQAEMVSEFGDETWLKWAGRVEQMIGHDLDGDENVDGYSLDGALASFQAGITAREHASEILSAKASLARW